MIPDVVLCSWLNDLWCRFTFQRDTVSMILDLKLNATESNITCHGGYSHSTQHLPVFPILREPLWSFKFSWGLTGAAVLTVLRSWALSQRPSSGSWCRCPWWRGCWRCWRWRSASSWERPAWPTASGLAVLGEKEVLSGTCSISALLCLKGVTTQGFLPSDTMPYYLIYLSREIRRFKEWTVSLNYIGNPQQSTELGTKYTCRKCFPVGLLVVVVVMVVCVCVCVCVCVFPPELL